VWFTPDPVDKVDSSIIGGWRLHNDAKAGTESKRYVDNFLMLFLVHMQTCLLLLPHLLAAAACWCCSDLCHPAKAEEAVKAQGFARAAIFRPGFLDRKEKARFIERMFAPLAGSVDVADVARVMIADAAAFKAGRVSGADTFENGEIKAAAKANTVT
jgi:hypothetical protein